MTGIDSSREGIAQAAASVTAACFKVASIYDERLVDVVGNSFDCIIALEVVEHLMLPKRLFSQAFRLLRPTGHLIVSTPYHGYAKNLAISLLNGWDRHFAVGWDGGHVKFFSKHTLRNMAESHGFRLERAVGVGRIPLFWKSMIMMLERVETQMHGVRA